MTLNIKIKTKRLIIRPLVFSNYETWPAINVDNNRSINLAKSVGMKKECTRAEFFFENGTWADHIIFTILSKSKKLEKFP